MMICEVTLCGAEAPFQRNAVSEPTTILMDQGFRFWHTPMCWRHSVLLYLGQLIVADMFPAEYVRKFRDGVPELRVLPA